MDERCVEDRLTTGPVGGFTGQALPDVDLLVRTAGELRVSNYLLWQISYSEIVIVKKYWPEFRKGDLLEAVEEYQRRHRRFGAL